MRKGEISVLVMEIERLYIVDATASVGGIAHMADAHAAVKAGELVLGEYLGDKAKATEAFKSFCSTLDKTAKKGAISKNAADRRKARAAAKLNALA